MINGPVRVMDIRGTYKGGGGPDKTVLNSAVLHDKTRVYVLVTYLRDPQDKEFQITEKAEKLGINYVEVLDRRVIDITCLLDLRRLILSHNLEIYHSHDDKTLLYGVLLKILIPGLKIIYTCHGNFPPQITAQNCLRHFFSLFLKKQHLKPIMAVSEYCRKKLSSYGINVKDIVTLHNGIDLDKWQTNSGNPVLKEELNMGLSDILVGTVARIDPQKDLHTFLKVAEIVVAHTPKIKFVIAGDGKHDELSKLKNDIKDMGLENSIILTGHRNDIHDIYASMDIFLMTSIMEGLPNTVLEAMAMQIPVVSTAVSGVPEIISDHETGFLCGIGDARGLAKSIITLIEDDVKRSTFGKQSREKIEQDFSFKDRVRKLEDMYEYFKRLN